MKKFLILPIVAFLFLVSCNGRDSDKNQTILTGQIEVLVDESLAPLVKEQLHVFEYSYTNAEISLVIKPENLVINDLINDSAEVAVLTRLLNADELRFFEARGFTPRITKFAIDGVALITNKENVDSTFTVQELIAIMQGNGDRRLVFDNANSGTVRYLKELAGVDTLPQEGVYAVDSNPGVIQFVAENKNSIGVVGVNWIGQPDSATRLHLNAVRVLKVKNLPGLRGDSDFYTPSQSNLAEDLYPLSRPVYLINAQPRYGLGMGFAAFLGGDRGQRIVLKSGLMPDSLPPRELIMRVK